MESSLEKQKKDLKDFPIMCSDIVLKDTNATVTYIHISGQELR